MSLSSWRGWRAHSLVRFGLPLHSETTTASTQAALQKQQASSDGAEESGDVAPLSDLSAMSQLAPLATLAATSIELSAANNAAAVMLEMGNVRGAVEALEVSSQ